MEYEQKYVEDVETEENEDLVDVYPSEPRESLVEYDDPEEDNDDEENSKLPSKKPSLKDVLNAVLPPRRFFDPNKNMALKQFVSTRKPERDDVVALQMKLDQRLHERQARESGLCPVREELYSQCFDELIRQVAIETPERGLLLLKVKNEIKMTIAAYQALYKSSITFGARKSLQAEQGNVALEEKLEKLKEKKKALQSQLQEQRLLQETIEKRTAEERNIIERKMMEEKEFLKYQAQHLESFLKTLQHQAT